MNVLEIRDGWDVASLLMHGAFDELHGARLAAYTGDIQVSEIDPVQCFYVAAEILTKQNTARRCLVKSVALFQAGMESLISYWGTKYPEIEGGGGFVNRWIHAFESKGLPSDFDDYACFYRGIRNAIMHPETDERIATINTLRFLSVHRGIRSGWDAFEKLGSAIGEQHDEDSWGIMCRAHDVPENPSDTEFPDLEELCAALYKRHTDELNKD